MENEYADPFDPSALSCRARGLASRLNRFAAAMDGEITLGPEELPADALTLECVAMGETVDQVYREAMAFLRAMNN
ncbi:MAG TPA: hypothetical protein VLT62_19060 [Candidatus Methylomirabilis sp.]|nr:hypothetical protein [Candidatus Methylomirabilis sp.]